MISWQIFSTQQILTNLLGNNMFLKTFPYERKLYGIFEISSTNRQFYRSKSFRIFFDQMQIALCYSGMGDHKTALELHRDVAEKQAKVIGDTHLDYWKPKTVWLYLIHAWAIIGKRCNCFEMSQRNRRRFSVTPIRAIWKPKTVWLYGIQTWAIIRKRWNCTEISQRSRLRFWVTPIRTIW